jgi:TolB protein
MPKHIIIALFMFIPMALMAGCGSEGRLPQTSSITPPTPTARSLFSMATKEVPEAQEGSQAAPPSPTVEDHSPPATPTSGLNWYNAGLIAFYTDRDGNPEIYTMNADGTGLLRLTNDPGSDDSPAFSPDGSRIAFLTSRHDPDPRFPNYKYEIYVVERDGSNLRRLTNTEAGETHPAWSPDGSKILFDADYDGDGYFEIYCMDSDGTNVTRLTANPANDQFADWSPDGKQIAFSSDREGNWDIFLMDANGENQRQLTSDPDWELFPAWSPDGNQIAYNGLQPNTRNTDIYLLQADGSQVRQLTSAARYDENPAWSPDGKFILFQTNRDGNFEIYIMNADGSGQQPLLAQRGDDFWPTWGPVPGK